MNDLVFEYDSEGTPVGPSGLGLVSGVGKVASLDALAITAISEIEIRVATLEHEFEKLKEGLIEVWLTKK